MESKMTREYQYFISTRKTAKTHLIFSLMMRNGLAEIEAACGYTLGGRLDRLPLYKNKQKHWIWCKKCLKEAGINKW